MGQHPPQWSLSGQGQSCTVAAYRTSPRALCHWHQQELCTPPAKVEIWNWAMLGALACLREPLEVGFQLTSKAFLLQKSSWTPDQSVSMRLPQPCSQAQHSSLCTSRGLEAPRFQSHCAASTLVMLSQS